MPGITKFSNLAILIVAAALCLVAVNAALSEEFENSIKIDTIDTNPEPGRVLAGNDQYVLARLKALQGRADSDSAKILNDLDAEGLDNLPPPFMMEYARREWIVGRDGWAARYLNGRTRTLFDVRVCKDRSAAQFQAIIDIEFAKFEDFGRDYDRDVEENLPKYLRDHLDTGAFFNSKASAWWICSHGIEATQYALTNPNAKFEVERWFVGEAERERIKEEAIDQFSNAAAPSSDG